MPLNRSAPDHWNRRIQNIPCQLDRRKSDMDVLEHVAASAGAGRTAAADLEPLDSQYVTVTIVGFNPGGAR
jgi:hypothetical protein